MQIISFGKLKEFFETNPAVTVPMQDWFKRVTKAEWDNFSDLKTTFNSVDSMGNQMYVFNVQNHYRIVAKVMFTLKRIYIRWVGNNKDYSRIKFIENL